ncbi:MAG: winged helix-turn-helix transcriptional regulator [Clostridiales bacterium]|nr:winged helix-turn-helix transcriptional regulator [Clostridiales bacterium]
MTTLFSFKKPDVKGQTHIKLCDQGRLVFVDGKPCALTLQEFRLLRTLASCAGRVLSRELLLRQAWDYLSPGKSRMVDVHMQRLRRKLGKSLFQTVHGEGYKMMAVPVPKIQ